MIRRFLAVAACALAAAALLTGCTGSSAVVQDPGGDYRFISANEAGHVIPAGQRKMAGPFSGGLLSGGTFHSAQDAGKVVVVNFWAAWCDPCQIETPQFQNVYLKYKTKGVAFVGIDMKDERGKAKFFVHNNDITYPIVFDEPGETALRLGNIPTESLPFTVLIDQQGRVAAVYEEALSPKDLERPVNALLAEK